MTIKQLIDRLQESRDIYGDDFPVVFSNPLSSGDPDDDDLYFEVNSVYEVDDDHLELSVVKE